MGVGLVLAVALLAAGRATALAGSGPPAQSAGVRFGGVRMAEAAARTTVTLAAPSGFLVHWPPGVSEGRGGRLVLDLPRQTVPEAGVLRGKGAVRLVRYVQLPGRPPTVRVVLDMAEDAAWAVGRAGGTAVVVAAEAAPGEGFTLLSGAVVDQVYGDGEGSPGPAQGGGAGPLAGRVVVLDPGHGGHDPGALGARGTREKDVVLAVSLRLRDLLRDKGARVVMTRADDVAVGLYERAEVARSAGADAFLSVHANWTWGKSIRGVEAYYYPGGEGGSLAEAAVRQLARRLGVPARGALPADFVVLRETPAPAALVEVGFLSHPAEESLLADPRYREEVAAALAAAVEEFLTRAPGGTQSTPAPGEL